LGTIGFYGINGPLIGIYQNRMLRFSRINNAPIRQAIQNVDDALKEAIKVTELRDAQNYPICGNLLEPYFKKTIEYVHEYPENSIVLFAVEWNPDGSYSPKGYLIAFGKSYCIHLQLVCALKGYGAFLMKALLHYTNNLRVNVELDALSNVLTYYQQFGFEFKDICANAATDIGSVDRNAPDAEKRAKLEIILREIAKQNKLEIDAHKLFHIEEDLKAHYKDWKDEEIDFYAKSMAEKDMAILFITGEKAEPMDHEDHHH
jgi:hypothetical protein